MKVFGLLGILTVLLSGWFGVLWARVDSYRLDYAPSRKAVDSHQEQAIAQGIGCSTPRSQVILEMITGTW